MARDDLGAHRACPENRLGSRGIDQAREAKFVDNVCADVPRLHPLCRAAINQSYPPIRHLLTLEFK